MPYQYKREPLSDDEVNQLTNACDTFREKFVVWTLLDTGLRLSEFADLKIIISSGGKEGRNLHQSPPNPFKPRQIDNY